MTDHHTSNVSFTDLNNDGFDDAVYTAGDTIIAYDLHDSSTILWKQYVGEANGLNGKHLYGLEWYCAPTLADMNNDGVLDIILYGLDNKSIEVGPDGYASLYVLNGKNGHVLARHDFNDCSGYQHDIAIGEFDKSEAGLNKAKTRG